MTTLSLRYLSFPSSLLISFSYSASQVGPFPMLQILPQNLLLRLSFSTLLGLTPSPLNFTYFKIKNSTLSKFSIFCWYLLILALFTSILCLSSSITVFSFLLFTLYLSFNLLNLSFFFSIPVFLWFPFPESLLLVSNSLYPPQPYVSTLVLFSSYALLSSILSVLSSTRLLP